MTSIRLARNADFSKSNIGVFIPVSGLSTYNFFGGTIEKSKRNLVSGGSDLIVSEGTPAINPIVVGSNYVDLLSVSPRACFDTGLQEGSEWTMMVAAMSPQTITTNAERPFLIGNLTSTSGQWSGAGMYLSETGAVVATLGNTANRTSSVLTSSPYAPAFYALTLGGGIMKLYNKTNGTTLVESDSRSTPLISSTKFRIGSSGNATNLYGKTRAYFSSTSSTKALSETEIDTIYLHVKQALKSRGVII